MSLRERPFKIVRRPGDRASASELNRAGAAIERISTLSGPNLHGDGAGYHFRPPDSECIDAQLTAKDDSLPPKYSWVQVIPNGTGGFTQPGDAISGSFTSLPAYEFNSVSVSTPAYVKLYKGQGPWMYFYAGSAPRAGTWYTEYLHIENLQANIIPGAFIDNDEYIGDIASKVNSNDFGGTAHLHWGLGDGLQDFHPTPPVRSNVGQTVDLASYFNDSFGIPIASDHDPLMVTPYFQHLSTSQISAIKERLVLPIDSVDFPAAQMWQNSTEHYGYEYYCLDWFSVAGGNTDAGKKVYNSIHPDSTDVVTMVLFVENLDNEVDPGTHRLGWTVILKHEILSEQVPDDIPLVGVWSRPDSPDFPTFHGYFSHIQFHTSYPLTRTGSILYVEPTTGSTGFDLTVEEEDEDPSYSDINKIQFNQDDGFIVTQPDPNTVLISMDHPANVLNVGAADGSPLYTDVDTILFDEADGFVITNPGGAGTVRVDLPPFNLIVGAADANPLYSSINTLVFDEADGFIITNPSAGVARIDLSSAGFNLTVMEYDTSPTYSNINTIIFDDEDGFILTQPGAGQVQVNLPNSQCWEANDVALDTDQNNYDYLNLKWIRFTRGTSPDNVNITGFLAPDPLHDGCPLLISYTHLTGGGSGFPKTITLKANSGSSSAGNKIQGPDTGTNDYVLYSGMSVLLRYDLTDAVWRIVAISAPTFRGANGTDPGTTGLVPCPAATDDVKFLKGTGTWANPLVIRKNSTGSEFNRRRLNLIEGTNTTLTVADDAGNNEVDVTFVSTTALQIVGLAGGVGSLGTVNRLDISVTNTTDFTDQWNFPGGFTTFPNFYGATGSNICTLQLFGQTVTSYALYAYTQGISPDATFSTSLALGVNDIVCVPIQVPASIYQPVSITLRNLDTSLARSCEWELMHFVGGATASPNPATISAVSPNAYGTLSFTPTVASNRTSTAAGVFHLTPGVYYLLIKNTHASNAFTLGCATVGTLGGNLCSYTTSATNLQSGDWSMATFLPLTVLPVIRINSDIP